MRVFWLAVALAAAALLAGCKERRDKPLRPSIATRKIRVVATTAPIAGAARQIGDKRVEVACLVGPGVHPSRHEATEKDVEAMGKADLILHNGLGLEAAMASTIAQMAERDIRTVAVTDALDRELVLTLDEGGQPDPRVWLDVGLWIKVVEGIRDTFVEIDPTHAQVYKANAKTHLEELDELRGYVEAQAKTIAVERRVLVAPRDVFRYFGFAYDFEVHSLHDRRIEAQADSARLTKLARFVAEHNVPAIFTEFAVPRKGMDAVKETVVRWGYDVAIGGELFADAIGEHDSPGATYLGMMRHNIDTIIKALCRR